MAESWWWYL